MILPVWLAVRCPICQAPRGRPCADGRCHRDRMTLFAWTVNYLLRPPQIERPATVTINIGPTLAALFDRDPERDRRRVFIDDSRIWRA